MSEWAILGLVALALYLLECLAWIEAPAVACFKPAPWNRWKCATGAMLPGNERGGFAMVDPTNVRGSLATCHFWPLSVSPQGLTNVPVDARSAAGEPRFIPFDDVRTVRAELGDVHVNEERFARVGSAVLARRLAGQIERIRRQPVEKRASEIKAVIAETLDERAALGCWARFQSATRTVNLCCLGLFVTVFACSPAILFVMGPYPSWLYLMLCVVMLAVITAIAYARAHAALYPESAYDRWVHVLSMILLPVAAIRCLDKLSRDALCHYSSAVVAPLLCGVADATPALRHQFVDMSCSGDRVSAVSSASALACAEWFRTLVATQTMATLDRLRVPVLKPPVRDDQTMVSYCPRCHAQFGRTSATTCPACSGARLTAFLADHTSQPLAVGR